MGIRSGTSGSGHYIRPPSTAPKLLLKARVQLLSQWHGNVLNLYIYAQRRSSSSTQVLNPSPQRGLLQEPPILATPPNFFPIGGCLPYRFNGKFLTTPISWRIGLSGGVSREEALECGRRKTGALPGKDKPAYKSISPWAVVLGRCTKAGKRAATLEPPATTVTQPENQVGSSKRLNTRPSILSIVVGMGLRGTLYQSQCLTPEHPKNLPAFPHTE